LLGRSSDWSVMMDGAAVPLLRLVGGGVGYRYIGGRESAKPVQEAGLSAEE